jgi:hypothetical protein
MNIAAILDSSRATDAFKADVLAFADHRPADRVSLTRQSPRVKVLRVLAQLATHEPDFAVDRVTVTGVSGCADFTGTLAAVAADGAERRYEFAWDCHWRAQQEGWEDCFGLPDQIRAAQTFGWDCFMKWRRTDAEAAGETADAGVASAQG